MKDFINSSAGSGKPVEVTFLEQTCLAKLPDWLVGYRSDLREAASRDLQLRPDVASAFKSIGMRDRDVLNKTHYVLNSELERKDCDAAMSRRDLLVETVAFESDGHPCVPLTGDRTPQWDTLVLGLMNADLPHRKHFRSEGCCFILSNKFVL